MPFVFLSHASGDRALADQVKAMIQTAVGIGPTEIFYSSEKGTGIPAGSNFVDYMKERMRDATFVVAIITPAYRESEFCLAELGAVWVAAEKTFFPLCVPSVNRDSLKATLTGIQVERIDESGPLSELLQRLCAHFGKEHVAAACDKAIRVFEATLPAQLDHLATPKTVPAKELEDANDTIKELGAQLAAKETELSRARKQIEEIKSAKTKEEIEAIVVPDDEQEQVEMLLGRARNACDGLKSIVKKVLPYRAQGNAVGMPWPKGGWERDDVQEIVDEGYLSDGEDGCVYVNEEWPDIEAAVEAVVTLQECLKNLSPEGRAWFRAKYDVPPDVTQAAVFARLL